MMALHITRETATFRRADHIHALAHLEDRHRQLLAFGVAFFRLHAQLTQRLDRRHFARQRPALGVLVVGLQHAQMAALRPGKPCRLLRRVETDLNGGIAVILDRTDLRHIARPGFDHGDRHGFAGVREHLGHTQLTTN
jgi:hypothetical protein